MKSTLLTLLLLLSMSGLLAQGFYELHLYEVSAEYPFGRLNPAAPEEVGDWAPLIGECPCRSVMRIDQNTWADTVDMVWRWKYIMNGMAVQDETFKADSTYAGSIRQFNPDSTMWYVHYYSATTPTPRLPSWEGYRHEDGKIILYQDQKAPNGMDGKYKITFSNITEAGYDWLGEWVTPDESFSYPTWRIYCRWGEE